MTDSSAQQVATMDVPYRTGSGGWVYLPDASARNHPLYGVYAWALLLLAFLAIGPILLVYQDIRILASESQRPDEFWIVLIAEVVFLAAAWKAAGRLGRESSDFSGYFYVVAVLGLCTAALYFAILVESGPREFDRLALTGFLWRSLPVLLWTFYVFRSRRINVTTRKRVPSSDPFLRAQWLSDRPESARPVARRSLVSRGFMRQQPEGVERRGAVREPPERARRRPAPAAAPTPEDEDDQIVVVHRPAASPRRRRALPTDAIETYSPRRPVRSLAGALEPYSPRRPLMRRDQPETGIHHPLDDISHREDAHTGGVGDRTAPDAEILSRLRQLQLAREEGLITAAEERAKRQELLKEL